MPDGIVRARSTAVSPETLTEQMRQLLAEEVGLHKPWSVQELAAVSGVPQKEIYKLASGEVLLAAYKVHSVLNGLGPSAWSRVLAPAGMAARRVDVARPDHAGVLTKAGSLIAELGEAFADGRVDSQEARALLPAARQLRDALDGLLTHHAGERV